MDAADQATQPVCDDDIYSIALMALDHELTLETDDLSDALGISMLDDERLYLFGADVTLRSPATSTNHGTVPPKCAIKTPDKASPYRNRKRQELENLRSTVKTLQVRLTALKTLPIGASQPTNPSRPIWETLALVESEQRQEAELKNKELREKVELHHQLAQKLQSVLEKVCAQCGVGATLQPKSNQ